MMGFRHWLSRKEQSRVNNRVPYTIQIYTLSIIGREKRLSILLVNDYSFLLVICCREDAQFNHVNTIWTYNSQCFLRISVIR